jgi:hypothetical protein
MPGPRGESRYENIRLFPAEPNINIPLFAYDVMKKSQPQIVITIGHYVETDFIHSIKSLYPHLFKWIALITSGSSIINEKHRDTLNYADSIIALNNGSYEGLKNLLTTTVNQLSYGAGEQFFDKGEQREGILLSAKNSQISNIPAYLRSMGGFDGTIHYNANDVGFYDVPLLLRRYGLERTISTPKKFISVIEGISDTLMNNLYNRHSIVVDCSMQSTTSISMLEAMRTGCIPVGVDSGASRDVLEQLPDDFKFLVPCEIYIGENEETFSIISNTHLTSVINKAVRMSKDEKWTHEARKIVKSLSEEISKDKFLYEVNQIVTGTLKCQHAIVVDSLV